METPMKCTARFISGAECPLELVSTDTIFDIKEKIAAQIEGQSALDLRLIFQGKRLEDGRTVRDYNITEKFPIHTVVRLRGGATVSVKTFTGGAEPLFSLFLPSCRILPFHILALAFNY
jgi:hypothetical protein